MTDFLNQFFFPKRYLDHQKPGHHHHQHHSLNETTDSDYSSLRSESSAANSEVSSIVSNQSSTASAAVGASNSGNPGLASSKRHHNPTGRISTSTSSGSMSQSNPMSESSGSNLSGKRRSSEEVSGNFQPKLCFAGQIANVFFFLFMCRRQVQI